MSGRPIEVDQRAAGPHGGRHRHAGLRAGREIKALVVAGEREAARDRFGALVALLQRRGLRIAYHYLRDAADADEAVQDAFVKVFLHIEQYREDLSFDVWFMRILVNACLDRLKSRTRQQRWMASPVDDAHEARPVEQAAGAEPSSEHRLLVAGTVAAGARRRGGACRIGSGWSSRCRISTSGRPREISEATGMSPATVRVHLFRAIRKLRALLGDEG